MTDAEEASAAFGALGNGTRVAALRALYANGECPTHTFTELFEATEADTTAGFAYHLRQLTGQFVEKVEDEDANRYRLTDAGRRLARTVAAGTYTDSTDHDELDVVEPCPTCGADELYATGVDNVLTVACGACGRDLLALPFPPAGHDRSGKDLLEAFDSYHRHRIAASADSTCPDCGGPVRRRVEILTDEPEASQDEARAIANFSCASCGYALTCPVALAVRSHAAVVARYERAGEDVRERPVWNIGEEWSERVLSTDPVCVEVATRIDGEFLALLVGRDLTVGHIETSTLDDNEKTTEEPAEAAAA